MGRALLFLVIFVCFSCLHDVVFGDPVIYISSYLPAQCSCCPFLWLFTSRTSVHVSVSAHRFSLSNTAVIFSILLLCGDVELTLALLTLLKLWSVCVHLLRILEKWFSARRVIIGATVSASMCLTIWQLHILLSVHIALNHQSPMLLISHPSSPVFLKSFAHS